ncbi:MAG TPA: Holliday junction resolvase RuvX, partial [Candidatus Caenarcaniphilales bacterium]|nr:Holliday junction resolvase RuvX [Candidatus Caenarcaniphilales bacterium]
MTRLLGIDLGTRRIGLAVADTVTASVRPLTTVRRGDPERDIRTLATIVAEQRVDEFVVGLPRSLDGSEGQQAIETRRWAEEVLVQLARPIHWRDERLTSERAERTVGRTGRGRSGGPPTPTSREAHRA